MSDRNTVIDGQRHPSASNGPQGRAYAGVMSPVVTVNTPTCSTGPESLSRRPNDGRLALADSHGHSHRGQQGRRQNFSAAGHSQGTRIYTGAPSKNCVFLRYF